MQIRQFIALMIGMIFFAIPSFGKDKPLKITEGGKSVYVIIVSAKATASEQQAAELLQEYISRISGCMLTIADDKVKAARNEISIGFTNRIPKGISSEMDPDEFLIITIGKKLFILGGNHKGTYYGVVDLLEKHLGSVDFANSVTPFPNLHVLQPNNSVFNQKRRIRAFSAIQYHERQRNGRIKSIYAGSPAIESGCEY